MDKKSTTSKHNAESHDESTLCIYTDGSGIDGHVGAAAVSPQLNQYLQCYLGTEKEYNVYAAEITGFELATNIAITSPQTYSKCIIYADTQAAIQGINKPSRQSGQAHLISAINEIQALKDQRQMAVEIKWVPGHEGVKGNEEADEAAKEAAKSEGIGVRITKSTQKPLKSARLVCIKRELTDVWNKTWQANPQSPHRHDSSQHLRGITRKPNALRGAKLYKAVTLTRHQASQLAQLRTGHCSVNQYLHRFGHVESPLCECGSGATETVKHFLLNCPRYDKQRARLLKEVGICGMRMDTLLGRPGMIHHTLKYVKETKRFPF
jgi:ribonuclease HI